VKTFTKEDGAKIRATGIKMKKKPNPVYLIKQNEPFEVVTNEGLLRGHDGGYVAHDPISGHVWPISADYVSQHYEDF